MYRIWSPILVALGMVLFLGGCASLPETLPQGTPGYALAAQPDGVLASIEERLSEQAGPAQSGFHLLNSNEAGLRWRLALIDSAKHSLDLQYYVWWGDESGDLLMKRVIDAADRGVKVRLILDDLSTMLEDESHPKLRDTDAALIDAHPNLAIRLFNPWRSRPLGSRALEMLDRMERLNHRMHNKLLIADNRATILGGRNIGNEYFGLSPTFNFRDLDILGVGPVVQQASQVFDRFWNSEWVVPVAELNLDETPNDLREEYREMRRALASAPALARFQIGRRSWEKPLDAAASKMHIGTSRMHTDIPDPGTLAHHMPAAIRALLGKATSEILITNAYIIPGEHAIGRMREQTANGVRIRMLTNSLASHDVPAVNSHYKRWRKPLLDAGIELYEARPDAAVRSLIVDTPPTQAEYMGLHMKAMVIDRRHVFVGSMNLDPRSWEINSEMGIVVDSPGLGEELAQVMDRDMGPENAWLVSRNNDGRVTWSDGEEVFTRQPARNFWQRVEDVLFMAFPGELY